MKKILFLAALAGLAFSFSACEDNTNVSRKKEGGTQGDDNYDGNMDVERNYTDTTTVDGNNDVGPGTERMTNNPAVKEGCHGIFKDC